MERKAMETTVESAHMHNELVGIINKPPEQRTEYECLEMAPWLQGHSGLFSTLKSEIVSDVIRYCEFERRHRDEVIIKQGENGEKLYIILKGAVSIYVNHDKETSQEVLEEVEKVCAKAELNREHLGHHVWTAGEGKSVGEVALLKDDCIRTASVVVDCDTDLVVIDRSLYNRSVKDVLEREFKQKTSFVESNTLFRQWPAKQRKLLVVALKKESVKYGCPLIRQGLPAECMYFILNGECEITCDQSLFKGQYDDLWREMETLLPGLLPKTQYSTVSPHERLRSKKLSHKLQQMCLLGSNETVGALEVVLGMDTSMESAIVAGEADVLTLSRENFNRLFSKKYAQRAIEILRERLTMRLYLYIHRTRIFDPENGSPFLKFLSFITQDEGALNNLKRLKRKEREEREGITSNITNNANETEGRLSQKETKRVNDMLKKLDIKPHSPHGRLPMVESGQKVINEIEAGLEGWIERSRGASPLPDARHHGVKRHGTFGGNERKRMDLFMNKYSRSRTPTK